MERLEELIQAYGYFALLVGTFLEGETILLLAGFMAWQGVFEMPLVITFATAGATAGDQTYFYLGRYRRDWIFSKFPKLRLKAEKVYGWVERHPDLIIIGSRFVYGFRIATPIVLGTSRVAAWRYSVFNLVGAIIWAITVSSAGYFLGDMMERLIGDMHRIQHYLFLSIAIIGLGVWLYHRVRLQREEEKKT
jgi:membrane protein DedA with SNARE-associated domain